MAEQTLAQTLEAKRKKKRQQEGSTQLVRGSGGQLQNITGEEVQSLSSKLGRDAPPTSPLDGSKIGMSPDQTKMLGDARQKRAALDIGLGGESQVSQSTRTEAKREDATVQEQQMAAKRETLSAQYGDMGGKIADMMQAELGKLSAAEAAKVQADEGDPTQVDAINQAIAAIQSGTDIDTATAAALNAMEAAGVTGIDAETLKGTISNKAAERAAELTTYSAGQVLDPATMEALGYAGQESDLAEALGVSEADLAGMTLDDLQAKVQSELDEEFRRVSDARAIMSDPNASPAMRQEARRLVRDLGSVGTLSQAEQAQSLKESIESADTIDIGGESYSVAEIFDDENMERLTADFLNMDEKARDKLRESQPELAQLYDFIEMHEGEFNKVTEGLSESSGRLVEGKTKRADVAGRLGEELMNDIMPGWEKFTSGTAPDMISDILENPSSPTSVRAIEHFKSMTPEMLKYVKGLSSEKLSEIGLKGEDPDTMGQAFSQFQTRFGLTQAQSMEDLASSYGTTEDKLKSSLAGKIQEIAGGLGNVRDHVADEDLVKEGFLTQEEYDLWETLDSDRDGELDDWSTLDASLDSLFEKGEFGQLDAVAGISGSTDEYEEEQIRKADEKAAADAKWEAGQNIKNIDKEYGDTSSIAETDTDSLRTKLDSARAKLAEISAIDPAVDTRYTFDEKESLESKLGNYISSGEAKVEADTQAHEQETNKWETMISDVARSGRSPSEKKKLIEKQLGWQEEGSVGYNILLRRLREIESGVS